MWWAGILFRHGRARPGHPRLAASEDVDARHIGERSDAVLERLWPGMTVKCGYVNLALGWRLTDFTHSPASIFLPSAGCTRVTLKRPSAQTTVKPSASTTAISPTLPAIPFGSFAGSGLASKIFSCLLSSVVQAPGAGLQPPMRRSILCHS